MTVKSLKVKPSEGFKIRDPDLMDLLPPEGRTVPDSMYWQRRIRDKDVELMPDDPPAPEFGSSSRREKK